MYDMKRMVQVLVVLTGLAMLAFCVVIAIKKYPHAWTEEEIRAYLTKDRIISDLLSNKYHNIKLEDLGFEIEYDRSDAESMDITVNSIGKTSYSVYGDEFNYYVTIRFNKLYMDGEVRVIEIDGKIETDYSSGGGRSARFWPSSARFID